MPVYPLAPAEINTDPNENNEQPEVF